MWLFRHEVVGAFVEGQKSSCDIVLLTKCQNVPGVNVTDSRPYLMGYRLGPVVLDSELERINGELVLSITIIRSAFLCLIIYLIISEPVMK